jgi:hypothetical protein
VAWPTRSKELALTKRNPVVSGTWYSLGGPASGETWLVKQIGFYNQNASTRKMYLRQKRSGVGYIVLTLSAATDTVESKLVNMVLEYGDTLEWAIGASFSNDIDVAVYGALLGS